MTVEWDPEKNRENVRTHTVSFEEAQEALLSGRDYYEVYDRTHSQHEDRFIAVGPTRRGILTVVWTEREEQTVRMISARAATRSERSLYRAYMEGRG